MSLRVVYRREAQFEIDEAYAWYEQRSQGVGERFLEAVREAAARVRERPESFALIWRDVRRCLTSPFPYGVYYRIRRGRIEIVAVYHGRRDPNAWKKRV